MKLDPLVFREAAEALADYSARDFAEAFQNGLWRRGITYPRVYYRPFTALFPEWLDLVKDNEHAHDAFLLMYHIVQNP